MTFAVGLCVRCDFGQPVSLLFLKFQHFKNVF